MSRCFPQSLDWTANGKTTWVCSCPSQHILYHFLTFSAVSATEQRKTAAFLPLQCWYSWLLSNPKAMEPGISYELKMNRDVLSKPAEKSCWLNGQQPVFPYLAGLLRQGAVQHSLFHTLLHLARLLHHRAVQHFPNGAGSVPLFNVDWKIFTRPIRRSRDHDWCGSTFALLWVPAIA